MLFDCFRCGDVRRYICDCSSLTAALLFIAQFSYKNAVFYSCCGPSHFNSGAVCVSSVIPSLFLGSGHNFVCTVTIKEFDLVE